MNALDFPALRTLMEDNERLKARIAQLESLSATDSLTGAWNRAQLASMVDIEINRALRSGQPVTLILLDIDHFKRVNDAHGHLTGDAVLTEFVARIRKRMRNTDSLFRWGGDEFVVLATHVGYRGGAALAEDLRSTIVAAPFAEAESITASMGVTEYKEGESAESWFRRTDEALYAAKSAGRNRIHVDRQGNSELHADQVDTAMNLLSRSEGAAHSGASRRLAMRLWASTWGPRSRVVELTLANHDAPVDHRRGDVTRAAEHERRDRIVQRAGVPEAVDRERHEIGGHPRREVTDVVAAQHARASPRGELQRVARRQRAGIAGEPREEQRLARLGQHLAAVVGRAAVDTEADGHARVAHPPHGRDAGSEAHVGARAMRDSGAGPREERDPGGVEVHAVRVPDVGTRPAQRLGVLGRRPARTSRGCRRRRQRSRRDACAGGRRSCGRASADSRIRSSVTLNGEHGAMPTRIIARGAGSWNVSITRRASRRIASSSSVNASGGRPPRLSPRLIAPRVA